MKTNRVCLLFGLALAVAASAADTGRGVAVEPVLAVAPRGNAGLFFGVNQFSEDRSLRPLQFAVNDAIAQAHLFALDLKLLAPANTYLALSGEPTTDAAKTQLAALQSAGVQRVTATKTGLLRTLSAAAALATGGDDLLIVSLSSHGFEERGLAYVLPADGLHTDLQETGVNLGTVEQRLSQSKAGKRLLLVDACRENPAPGTRGAGDSPMSAAFRAALAAAQGQAVLASCDAGQLSLENPELGHGVFTFFLLEALKGKAVADPRGFITLGAVKEYVAQSVQDWVVRNRPGIVRDTAQRPWFKGPTVAEQIPLAVDPGIRARLGAFRQDIATIVASLRAKINRKGEFTTAVYDRLGDAFDRAQDDEAGRNLLKKSRDFATGSLDEDAFVAYLGQVIETPEQRGARMGREAAARAEQEMTGRIAVLLASAQANDNKENGKTALTKLEELLRLDPVHQAALALRKKISGYYGPNVGDIKTIDIGQGVKMELVWIPPGEFMMGSNEKSDEQPPHQVTINKGFWLGKYEVTQEQYQVVIGNNPSQYRGAQKPVEIVGWDNAVAFCRKINARLPTEAEWEYACRAGTKTRYYSGDTDNDLAQAGWYFGNLNSSSPTSLGGLKAPNAWGLCDMHGNVWEWCDGWYSDNYNQNDSGSGRYRVMRGGSFSMKSDSCRSASRFKTAPGGRSDVGFRVAVDSP